MIFVNKATASASNGLLNSLVSYWRYDDADVSGSTLSDVHGSNDGTITGATTGSTGLLGESFSYDGSGDYVNFGNVSTPSAYSISVWFNLTDVTDFRTIITKGNLSGSSEAFKIRIRSITGYVNSIVWYSTGLSFDAYNGSTDLSDGSWHHVVQTFDGDIHKLYVDNSNVYTSASLGGSTQSPALDLQVGISGHPSVHQYMDGNTDEYGLWSRILDADDVSALWNGGSGLSYSNFTT